MNYPEGMDFFLRVEVRLHRLVLDYFFVCALVTKACSTRPSISLSVPIRIALWQWLRETTPMANLAQAISSLATFSTFAAAPYMEGDFPSVIHGTSGGLKAFVITLVSSYSSFIVVILD